MNFSAAMAGGRNKPDASWSRLRPSPAFLLVGELCLLLSSPSAFAYVGPGAGLTAIGSAVALVAAIVVAIIGFLWYPLKRILKRNKSDDDLATDSDAIQLEGIDSDKAE